MGKLLISVGNSWPYTGATARLRDGKSCVTMAKVVCLIIICDCVLPLSNTQIFRITATLRLLKDEVAGPSYLLNGQNPTPAERMKYRVTPSHFRLRINSALIVSQPHLIHRVSMWAFSVFGNVTRLRIFGDGRTLPESVGTLRKRSPPPLSRRIVR